MRRVFNSSVRGVAAVAMMLALAGSAVAAPREDRDRERGREPGVVKVVKKIIRALGDGLTIPRP